MPESESTQSLSHLRSMAEQLDLLSGHLVPFAEELDADNVQFVRGAAEALVKELEAMEARASVSGWEQHPLSDREARHDVRNRIAVVSGFSDLMLMDVSGTHVTAAPLRELRSIAGEFVKELDALREEDDGGARLFES